MRPSWRSTASWSSSAATSAARRSGRSVSWVFCRQRIRGSSGAGVFSVFSYRILFFPKDFISGYSKQEAWARGEGAVTGIFGPNRTYKVGYSSLMYPCPSLAGPPPSYTNFRKSKFFARRFAPKCSPRRSAAELHKLSKIEIFRSALRAGRVRKLTSGPTREGYAN